MTLSVRPGDLPPFGFGGHPNAGIGVMLNGVWHPVPLPLADAGENGPDPVGQLPGGGLQQAMQMAIAHAQQLINQQFNGNNAQIAVEAQAPPMPQPQVNNVNAFQPEVAQEDDIEDDNDVENILLEPLDDDTNPMPVPHPAPPPINMPATDDIVMEPDIPMNVDGDDLPPLLPLPAPVPNPNPNAPPVPPAGPNNFAQIHVHGNHMPARLMTITHHYYSYTDREPVIKRTLIAEAKVRQPKGLDNPVAVFDFALHPQPGDNGAAIVNGAVGAGQGPAAPGGGGFVPPPMPGAAGLNGLGPNLPFMLANIVNGMVAGAAGNGAQNGVFDNPPVDAPQPGPQPGNAPGNQWPPGWMVMNGGPGIANAVQGFQNLFNNPAAPGGVAMPAMPMPPPDAGMEDDLEDDDWNEGDMMDADLDVPMPPDEFGAGAPVMGYGGRCALWVEEEDSEQRPGPPTQTGTEGVVKLATFPSHIPRSEMPTAYADLDKEGGNVCQVHLPKCVDVENALAFDLDDVRGVIGLSNNKGEIWMVDFS